MENLMSWYDHKLKDADFYRLGIMAFILLVQANVLIPATLLAISMNGGSSFEFAICTAFSFGLLVSLLGGAPAKFTLPLFIVSTVVHLLIIFTNVI